MFTAPNPTALTRWSPAEAAPIFACSVSTLRRRLKKAKIKPGADGRYSTRDVIAALAECEADWVREYRARIENWRIRIKSHRAKHVRHAAAKEALALLTDKSIAIIEASELPTNGFQAWIGMTLLRNSWNVTKKRTSSG